MGDPFLRDETLVEEDLDAAVTEQVAINRTDANPANPPSEQPVGISAVLFDGAQEFDVKLERLSDVLSRRPEFSRIDFLKVDVEGAELEVLRGLDDAHWGIVRNVVLETWDASGVRGEIEELLRAKGFTLKCEEAPWSKGFWMISASREG
ncbi:hypothetical protein EKO27_g9192 [Xylaria grammica]|uniref:Methyltransferase FkbM domain-containing protein n=1 Tax=Xylaria grammica TaxID=363999 RepID=A0A439CUR8_9PEZI|nr:hypothetical protein EKO27_g9192 [Xylaria grammica]